MGTASPTPNISSEQRTLPPKLWQTATKPGQVLVLGEQVEKFLVIPAQDAQQVVTHVGAPPHAPTASQADPAHLGRGKRRPEPGNPAHRALPVGASQESYKALTAKKQGPSQACTLRGPHGDGYTQAGPWLMQTMSPLPTSHPLAEDLPEKSTLYPAHSNFGSDIPKFRVSLVQGLFDGLTSPLPQPCTAAYSPSIVSHIGDKVPGEDLPWVSPGPTFAISLPPPTPAHQRAQAPAFLTLQPSLADSTGQGAAHLLSQIYRWQTSRVTGDWPVPNAQPVPEDREQHQPSCSMGGGQKDWGGSSRAADQGWRSRFWKPPGPQPTHPWSRHSHDPITVTSSWAWACLQVCWSVATTMYWSSAHLGRCRALVSFMNRIPEVSVTEGAAVGAGGMELILDINATERLAVFHTAFPDLRGQRGNTLARQPNWPGPRVEVPTQPESWNGSQLGLETAAPLRAWSSIPTEPADTPALTLPCPALPSSMQPHVTSYPSSWELEVEATQGLEVQFGGRKSPTQALTQPFTPSSSLTQTPRPWNVSHAHPWQLLAAPAVI
ncbi:hypothetical protein P7K49_023435 [Saguinus oedipus]|uniref:Uncharacterized protein n=1 Tax=Saguinus oedipus TaxID=9490 RepID=A0ABQ9ULQ4_SAGOE|nr:hypothetical protein P7K49_023435 [Saguinus oedipus]